MISCNGRTEIDVFPECLKRIYLKEEGIHRDELKLLRVHQIRSQNVATMIAINNTNNPRLQGVLLPNSL